MNADFRQHQAFNTREISLSLESLVKVKILEAETSKPKLGLSATEYDDLARSVTHIVHNAWPMSITRPIRGFELQFAAMQNLINFARDIVAYSGFTLKVGFQFISSIATVGLHPLRSCKPLVPEEQMSIESVLPTGYGDAKLVCEKMLEKTLYKHPKNFKSMIVRIGQIAGSKTSGYWNPVEHFAFLIKSCQTLRALPDFQGV